MLVLTRFLLNCVRVCVWALVPFSLCPVIGILWCKNTLLEDAVRTKLEKVLDILVVKIKLSYMFLLI